MILGITGGIASGKSFVAETFLALGAALISADQLAREVVEPGSPHLACLVERFGDGILGPDGRLERKVLGEKIFADPQARREVNRLLHPAIGALAEERLARLARDHELVVYEAPLLYEAGADKRVEAVLVVRIEEGEQLRRLMLRDGICAREARDRIDAQMPQAEKVARADYVIDNSGTREETVAQVRALMERFRSEGLLHVRPGNGG